MEQVVVCVCLSVSVCVLTAEFYSTLDEWVLVIVSLPYNILVINLGVQITSINVASYENNITHN